MILLLLARISIDFLFNFVRFVVPHQVSTVILRLLLERLINIGVGLHKLPDISLVLPEIRWILVHPAALGL